MARLALSRRTSPLVATGQPASPHAPVKAPQRLSVRRDDESSRRATSPRPGASSERPASEEKRAVRRDAGRSRISWQRSPAASSTSGAFARRPRSVPTAYDASSRGDPRVAVVAAHTRQQRDAVPTWATGVHPRGPRDRAVVSARDVHDRRGRRVETNTSIQPGACQAFLSLVLWRRAVLLPGSR